MTENAATTEATPVTAAHDDRYVVMGEQVLSALLGAYKMMLLLPDCEPLLDPLLDIVNEKARILSEALEDAGTEDDGDDVAAEVRAEGGQFCVYSEAGRAFGCYTTRDAADDRLAQIESFSRHMLKGTPDDTLIVWHKGFHRMPSVDATAVDAHDLVTDELIARGYQEPLEDATPLDYDEPSRGVTANMTVAKADEHRFTLGPVYVPGAEDAHGEFTDASTLQTALWNWMRKGDRTIFLQHSEQPAGEMVEMLTWPFPVEADLTAPNQGVTKFTFPSDTPFMGVVWEPWAWDLVKAGELRGYSIGGKARRVEVEFDG